MSKRNKQARHLAAARSAKKRKYEDISISNISNISRGEGESDHALPCATFSSLASGATHHPPPPTTSTPKRMKRLNIRYSLIEDDENERENNEEEEKMNTHIIISQERFLHLLSNGVPGCKCKKNYQCGKRWL